MREREGVDAEGFGYFYLDPPYWQTEGYGVPFAWAEYEAMAELLRTLQGKAILSINDHPDIRACFAGLHMERLEIGYSINNRSGAPAQRGELVIRSWDVEGGRWGCSEYYLLLIIGVREELPWLRLFQSVLMSFDTDSQ